MRENRPKRLPRFRTTQQLVDFFDSHDTGDYWGALPEASFKVDIRKRKRFVAVDEELMDKLVTVAKTKHVSSQRLVRTWLEEKLAKAA